MSRRDGRGGCRILLLAAYCAGGTAAAGSLREELEDLAGRHGFAVEGAEWLGPEAAESRGATPLERLRSLLKDYNYLLIAGGRSGIERVKITSRKDGDSPVLSGEATVPTARLGSHHQVEVTVAGPNGVARPLTLIVDTGASTLVLPQSLIAELGFSPEQLQDATAQTASGRVAAKLGSLASVRVGAAAARNVAVSFIADDRLQGAMLLGMSFLQRFRMTIDDQSNELILLQR